eukprot:TRINITY_DN8164_c0_g1_i2.p1 TRINITY_DN8164_c0_g1~~TRINITY_DN8164_c0_g1_i2.p1  ORF type:complete len:4596 (+),score=2011.83 TRINITY_DN8164_c0_g1_i2:76-13863(+)
MATDEDAAPSAMEEELQVPLMPLDTLLSYVKTLSSALLEVDAPAFDAAAAEPPHARALSQFIADGRHAGLVVTKNGAKLSLSLEVECGSAAEGSVEAVSVAFLKRVPEHPLVESSTPPQQLQIINLGVGSPFELLHNYLHNSLAPFFRSYLKNAPESIKSKQAGGFAAVSQKIADLELSLYNCKQDVQIEQISLSFHPRICAAANAAKASGKTLRVEDLGEVASSAEFLNELQAGVNVWIKDIQRVTKMDRIEVMPPTSDTAQEIKFWMELESALQDIEGQLNCPEATCTLRALRQAKRFHATVAFENDTIGMNQALAKVNEYKPLVRDFPLDGLLAATDINEDLCHAIVAIFSHLQKASVASYPLERLLRLVEAVARDLKQKLLAILGRRRLLEMPLVQFEEVMGQCERLFATWQDAFDKFRDYAYKRKRRTQSKTLIRMAIDVNPVHDRIQDVSKFRKRHEELRSVILRILPANSPAASEIDAAFGQCCGMDILDLTKSGDEQWEAAVKLYDSRIDRVESQITSRLRDQLATAKNANEMFRIFSQFNGLFFRQRIRSAIQEYQRELLSRVKDDIKALHEKYKSRYSSSNASQLSRLRDMPPVSGAIIWARQIERQLDVYMERVRAILGDQWELHADARELKKESDNFKEKLDSKDLFDQWVASVEGHDLQMGGRLFAIQRRQGKFSLQLLFDDRVATLFKEVRNMQWLGFRVPVTILQQSVSAKEIYPYAMSLSETVRNFEQSLALVAEPIKPLIAAAKQKVYENLAEGFKLRWSDAKLARFTRQFADVVTSFRASVQALVEKHNQIQKEMVALETCALTGSELHGCLDRIQNVVDALNLESYSNLSQWVEQLDMDVEEILLKRLVESLRAWVTLFEPSHPVLAAGANESKHEEEERRKRVLAALNHLPTFDKLTHRIAIRNQMVGCFPPVEVARVKWVTKLNEWLGVVCELPRIRSSRYDDSMSASLTRDDVARSTYRILLTRLPRGMLRAVYGTIQSKLQEVSKYVREWLQYQALWDMDGASITDTLGDDLQRWQVLLSEIKQARSTFDTTQTSKEFGPIVIDYKQVQTSISNKYDYWHKEALKWFGTRLGTAMEDLYNNIHSARTELEQNSVTDLESTSKAVGFIISVQDMKRKVSGWGGHLECYQVGQNLLQRQRYQFPMGWLEYDGLESEWNAFNEILGRKSDAINTELPALQLKIVAESKQVDGRLKEFYSDWSSDKPLEGASSHTAALETLRMFDGRLGRLREEVSRLRQAKAALDLEPQPEDRLDTIGEEVDDLKCVWNELAGVWELINQMKDIPWNAVVPRKVRRQLEDIQGQLKQLPSRMRQYAAYEHISDTVKVFLSQNGIVNDLRSGALRERHWDELRRRLGVSWILSDLTLGSIWNCDLKINGKTFTDIITQAQGELGIEEYIKEIKEYWQLYELDLVSYQNKCYLIRGWDELFAKLTEHSNSIGAMKASPFFKVFEEDANAWDDKLNRIRILFDTWIDVQRRWIYLEGIFSGSADIQNMLPVESSRFRSVNSEFIGIMRRVHKTPSIVDIVNFEGIQKTCDRIAEMLAKIQKALGDYLERQRASFPRFYFVGDEDLLEIIGNSKDIERIQKHIKKMFAGLSILILDEEKTTILGMGSSEGEQVMFKRAIHVKDHPKINEWLTKVESEMKFTLASILQEALQARVAIEKAGYKEDPAPLLAWIEETPSQLTLVASQILWTQSTENALAELSKTPSSTALSDLREQVEMTLGLLADQVLKELPANLRKKYEQLVTELVHERDVLRKLLRQKVTSTTSFEWLYEMRFYWNTKEESVQKKCVIRMANASFFYGFEYLGVSEKLVQTPLTDRCYLALTQALESRMGGSPFGPAGTGKTETVKALGAQLGRLVIVFCCDEAFDFQAMSRIFVGLCQCGAWGCFDEFNRLEERILSAVSQQIQTIQVALKEKSQELELLGRSVKLSMDMGIFITMNPGYAGRSNLPDNLKQLFRGIAMISPDRELIAQVMLYSQGFKTAEPLSAKIVPLFRLCKEQLSAQSHYDFGLRALKSVLVSAGNLQRARLKEVGMEAVEKQDRATYERGVMLKSISENIIPKLVAEDIPLFKSLLSDVFPGSSADSIDIAALRGAMVGIAQKRHLTCTDAWIDKQLQLFSVQELRHGVMLVGPSGSGKSTAWEVLLEAMEQVDGVESVSYVLDPKAISKDLLFGSLDATTREWTDGLFTHLLRKIIDNLRGELSKRHWIVFDGDVDPEWVENLNSLLDDNRILTLPNGERLALPPCVRIVFEVENLRYATPATVSRCGMIWFSEETVSTRIIHEHYLAKLENVPLDAEEAAQVERAGGLQPGMSLPGLSVQRVCAKVLRPLLIAPEEDGDDAQSVLDTAMHEASQLSHIMDFTRLRVLESTYSLVNKGVRNVIRFNADHPDFPMSDERASQYIVKRLAYSMVWGLGGSLGLRHREEYSNYIRTLVSQAAPPDGESPPLLDYFPDLESGEWRLWSTKVPQIEIEPSKAASPDVVIQTVDTIRHVEVLLSWVEEHKPMLLCGPPGSGKTMTLYSTLTQMPDYDVVNLNFSSATSPELLLNTFDHHCEYKRTPKGVVLRPRQPGKWIVVFCDEINLPEADTYGTQRVITFIRQLTERGGFWRADDHVWVSLERMQFVGACNPPTDPGRVPLTHRFLRHSPLLLVDFPAVPSLHQIYGTFCRALVKLCPSLRAYGDPLTHAMVEFYAESQRRFTPDMYAHYIYSPRELSRWVRALYEAIAPADDMDVTALVRVWLHEGLRLFQDRLVEESERKWTDEKINEIAQKHFPGMDAEKALARPVLFSNWLTKEYVCVEREELRQHVIARLKVFQEEELDVKLVVFDEVLDHILRIDRVFRQPQGHALLIGVSGGGKTVLSRFVAWMNGLSIFTIKVNNRYTPKDFDEDLRSVMRRAGCHNEAICFIFDESNVLESSFLERMNTLLASGEVPGLFEGDDYAALMHQCKEAVSREGLMLDTEDEMYSWFTKQVRRNLHVVFTMNPDSPDFHNRAATSPALYNRCVLDWFGEWSEKALFQVGHEFTRQMELDNDEYQPPDFFPETSYTLPATVSHRDAVVSSLVFVHSSIQEANVRLARTQGRQNYVTPRHYLDFISHFVNLTSEKRDELREQQLHLTVGLQKLSETQTQVQEMQESLRKYDVELEAKNKEANAKLKQMVADQQKAEEKKKVSEELQKKLAVQNAEVGEKRKVAYEKLENVEPMVEDAKAAVKSIKKKHLDYVRALPNPPSKVRLALEAVCVLLGKKAADWKDIRRIISDSNFVASVVTFNSENISAKQRAVLQKNYLSDPDFNFETINHASSACGPLVKWVIAQLSYSEILNSVQPLRNEVAQLEAKLQELQDTQDGLVKTISELEESIQLYKDEYAVLISETQSIKTERETVKVKVERSVSLLRNLSSEQERWSSESDTFQQHMSTVIGDALVSGSFLAYAGFFDQQYRESLLTKWKGRLLDVNVRFRDDLSMVEYLSHPDERLEWQANALPADDLCVENAIMLQRFNRYPLLIDPSGQAAEFLLKQFRSKKIVETSFLDSSFMKNLESALRFGTPLLVHDVESIDPVLNPVLNRETRKTGGRVLIRLGDQDVDFSPTFVIFLATRDPTAHFTPDLCSRVTFVNFTVTPSSLQSQCLNSILKSERPDIEEKRTDLLKLQGEFRVRLRDLEQALLNALSSAEGNILSNDKVMNTLETLKNEALDIQTRVAETELVFEEIMQTSAVYSPMAQSCSRIYFALEQLASVHFLYQFSLRFFLDIFHNILKTNPNLEGVKEPEQRLSILLRDLYVEIFVRVRRTLLHADQVTFAMRLVQIRVKDTPQDFAEAEFDFLVKGGEQVVVGGSNQELAECGLTLTERQKRMLIEIHDVAAFNGLSQHIRKNTPEWELFMESETPELEVPSSWAEEQSQGQAQTNTITASFRKLLLIKTLRPDRVLAAAGLVVGAVFGENFLHPEELNFANVVEKESAADAPLLLCSIPGHDASFLVDDLASESRVQYKAIAIGSPEGFEQANKSITAAAKNGSWVMLKNIHLAPEWLVQLEKRLHSLKPNARFRLFLSSDIHPKIPTNLLRMSHIFAFEPPPGIKANLQHTLSAVPQTRMDAKPVERTRLYFMLAWFHAMVQERLRYAPLGWTKHFEFGDADKRCAYETIDYWVNTVAGGRDHLPPEKIPWSALRTLLGQSVYGGRVDNDFDQRLLDSFLEHLFNPKCFDDSFPLVPRVAQLAAPEGKCKADFVKWVEALPENESPTWLGLPSTAELLLLVNQGKHMITGLMKMQVMDIEESSDDVSGDAGAASGSDHLPGWARSLLRFVETWKKQLMPKLSSLSPADGNTNAPLFRFFAREVELGRKLLRTIREDLEHLALVCTGEQKQTNRLRSLMRCISKGIVPAEWKKYAVPENTSLTSWLVDFDKRVRQLDTITKEHHYTRVWFGGLFNPEAFMTATRQASARAHEWSLEKLVLDVEVLSEGVTGDVSDSTSFEASGLCLEAASWDASRRCIEATRAMTVPLPPLRFTWRNTEEEDGASEEQREASGGRARVSLPVYLNETRLELLFSVWLDRDDEMPVRAVYQRGVALLATRLA